MITIQNVNKIYPGNVQALYNVSLEIGDSEIFSLLGVNGSGKTTLSSILATLHPATSGDVLYNGVSIYENINAFRSILGFCPQKPNLNTLLTIGENLYYDGIYYGLSHQEARRKQSELVERFELKKYENRTSDMLSGGYLQRVMIARALMHNPRFIIFDEPTVALDPHIRKKLWKEIINLKNDGLTVLLTTHYLEEAEYLADRVCILDRGKVRLIDTPENLKAKHCEKTLEDVFMKLMEEEPV